MKIKLKSIFKKHLSNEEKKIITKKVVSWSLIPIGLLIWLYLLVQMPLAWRIPKVGMYFESAHFYQLSRGFPPGNIKSKRFREIAKSLWHGHRDYHYDTNLAPPISK